MTQHRPRVAQGERSVPRAAIRSGDLSRDWRGRIRATPPVLHYGFRPFFFLAALHAGLAIPAWLWVYFSGWEIGGPFAGLRWHAHEMLFGYLAAVIAGFALTAVPNWTGRLPLSGAPLLVLVLIWLAGRVACLFVPNPWLTLMIDLAFPVLLSLAIWREVAAGRNWKNAPVALMISLFGLANALDHLANAGVLAGSLGQDLALAVAAVLISLIGGRIVPSFTRNWLAKRGAASLPAPFGALDNAALLTTALAMGGTVVFPGERTVGMLLCAAGALLAARLWRWRGLATMREPILFILHLGYGWLAASLVLMGLSAAGGAVPDQAAVHALTAGAIGTMTLAVMTRASLGHTGRAIVADRWIVAIYVLVTVGAALRVAALYSGGLYAAMLVSGGAAWSGAFLLFAARFAPVLFRSRVS